jgi:hydrogenase nickel incorporation protein HypA/HybF
MHELSMCLALLDQVQEIAREHRATRVERIVLRIGPLSGIEPSLLENAYPLAAAGTIAADAALEIEPAPVRVQCPECGAETETTPNSSAGTSCCWRIWSWRCRTLPTDSERAPRLPLPPVIVRV